MSTPLAGLPGPSRTITVEPVKVPQTSPAPPPPAPERLPEKEPEPARKP